MSLTRDFSVAMSSWQRDFYEGRRLQSEISLLAFGLTGVFSSKKVAECIGLIHRSYGVDSTSEYPGPFVEFQSSQPDPISLDEASRQYLLSSEWSDSLLFWVLYRYLPSLKTSCLEFRVEIFKRLVNILMRQRPNRFDLPYIALMQDPSGLLLQAGPRVPVGVGVWYSRTDGFALSLQISWVQGRYQDMWLSFLQGQLDGRFFMLTDHNIRGLSIIGEADRALSVFQALYNNNPSAFGIGSISNILFMALGCEELGHPFTRVLVSHFDGLACKMLGGLNDSAQLNLNKKTMLTVDEKPLLVVSSSDLRNHPVGRFWLPIARRLQSRFRVIYVSGNSHDRDWIYKQLQELSDGWLPLEQSDVSLVAQKILDLSPSLLIDLGGHTADNHPVLLAKRLATVQATYLGFYGPSYARCCDWWIVDQALNEWISNSYPGAEPQWVLPGPSLCYVPTLHGLPEPSEILYKEPAYSVFGSFNHTRKISSASQQRFSAILAGSPEAILKFRSHSFADPAVRRRFMRRLIDVGINAHQLQPLPYAPSTADAMSDYGRIHLHLDSYPVSGTTTTLDSLAMGIPVLTCPTRYYAGTISSAILEHAGLADHVCTDPDQLSHHARWLAERYRTAAARRALAHQVRQSPVCDDQSMPRMFVEQLQHMLRQALST